MLAVDTQCTVTVRSYMPSLPQVVVDTAYDKIHAPVVSSILLVSCRCARENSEKYAKSAQC